MTLNIDAFKPRDIGAVPTLVPSVLPERLQGYLARGQAALAAPFLGITNDGKPMEGLFPLTPGGVTDAKLVSAAKAFLALLDPSLRRLAQQPIDSELWRHWCNIHPYLIRHGACLHLLPEHARTAALDLLRAGFGARGYALARGVMQLNEHLCELTGRPDEYGPWFYWLTIFGEPSDTEPWGWQIDGHHLNVNCFVCGDQMVLTPGFLGSEPVQAISGAHQGLRVFGEEEAGGLALMRALSPSQQLLALIGDELPRDVFASAFNDNLVLPNIGIEATALSPEQQTLLLALADLYIARLPDVHAARMKADLRQHLHATRFAWIGGHDETATFYYRIYCPVLLMEFCHQPGQALGNEQPSRNHIHTIMRTPNGNDYGRAFLRQYQARASARR